MCDRDKRRKGRSEDEEKNRRKGREEGKARFEFLLEQPIFAFFYNVKCFVVPS